MLIMHERRKYGESSIVRKLKDYMELYVCLDTVLLAAVVETFRTSTHKHFRLDPMHYVSAPSLCFDAMLKITRIEPLSPEQLARAVRSHEMYGGLTGARQCRN